MTSLKLLEFTWKISKYSEQKLSNGPGRLICSQNLPANFKGNLKFQLGFCPHGVSEFSDGGEWTSLYLKTTGSDTYDTLHHFEFSIVDADGKKFGIRRFHKKIPAFVSYTMFLLQKDLENPANNLLPNDTLTICCRVEDTQSKTEGDCNCQIEKPETPQARLGRDLAALLNDKFADFVFKVENVKIPAHRAILAARSPVFDAMFQYDMKENKTNETEITDVTPAAFRALLQFIYTGHCQVGSLAEEILVAANKYDIRDLKQICAKELQKKLTVDNAVRLLVLSDLHQSEDLKDGAIRFINKNAPAFQHFLRFSAKQFNDQFRVFKIEYGTSSIHSSLGVGRCGHQCTCQRHVEHLQSSDPDQRWTRCVYLPK